MLAVLKILTQVALECPDETVTTAWIPAECLLRVEPDDNYAGYYRIVEIFDADRLRSDDGRPIEGLPVLTLLTDKSLKPATPLMILARAADESVE